MIHFDDKDDSIIEVLKENSSLSIQEIARKTGIAIATVHNRIKRLKSEGVIKKYTIVIDKAKLGRKMVAYVLIKATPKSDHIEDGSAITGEFDIILKVRVADIDELDKFVLKYLRTFNDVAQTQTMIAFENKTKV